MLNGISVNDMLRPLSQVSSNSETGEIIISGMGELHLEIYVERMKREYKVECEVRVIQDLRDQLGLDFRLAAKDGFRWSSVPTHAPPPLRPPPPLQVGKPKVSFRETIRQRAEFNYLHKKQAGGSGEREGGGSGSNSSIR